MVRFFRFSDTAAWNWYFQIRSGAGFILWFWTLSNCIEWTHKRKNSHYISMIR
ncbi:hypothetical protein D1AOALGA4SA_12746 [Olavius algarvensis Delta 1 endosymbiont]|nr:hypothetical protein D1AOALGA4SA_12746 [Olavius algarvensis Delta 1 endosymbiont]